MYFQYWIQCSYHQDRICSGLSYQSCPTTLFTNIMILTYSKHLYYFTHYIGILFNQINWWYSLPPTTSLRFITPVLQNALIRWSEDGNSRFIFNRQWKTKNMKWRRWWENTFILHSSLLLLWGYPWREMIIHVFNMGIYTLVCLWE